jgi:hypothetical protein
MLNVVMLNVVMLNVVMLNVVMLNVVMLNVVMLRKLQPQKCLYNWPVFLLDRASATHVEFLSRLVPGTKNSLWQKALPRQAYLWIIFDRIS